MKQIDALLNKVEIFEKLAVYGDRKSFLKTLAQEINTPDINDSADESKLETELNNIK